MNNSSKYIKGNNFNGREKKIDNNDIKKKNKIP